MIAVKAFAAIMLCGLGVAAAFALGGYREGRSSTKPAYVYTLPGDPAKCVVDFVIPGTPTVSGYTSQFGTVPGTPATPPTTTPMSAPCSESGAKIVRKATPPTPVSVPPQVTRWKVRPSWLDPARIIVAALGVALAAAVLLIRRRKQVRPAVPSQ